MKHLPIISLCLVLLCACNYDSSEDSLELQWEHELNSDVFDRAKKENKLILLNLGANWCHWCHVMEDSTYSDPAVISFMNKHFVYVHADQDANPQLSARYRKYGWPATIILNAKGEDILKKAGYVESERFLSLLRKVVEDPTPRNASPSLASIPSSNKSNQIVLEKLQDYYTRSLDLEKGGFKRAMKFIDWDTYEYALFHDPSIDAKMWRSKSIHGAYNLCDPVWGGVFQYSTHGDWEHQHFEKLLTKQAQYLRLFILDYQYNKREQSLKSAREIMTYCDRFLLQTNGLYANSQDADLNKGEHSGYYYNLNNEERLQRGIPAIDTNTYTSNNARVANALLLLYATTGEQIYLDKHEHIFNVLKTRLNAQGLYNHNSAYEKVQSLRDNIAMAALYVERAKLFGYSDHEIKALERLFTAISKSFLLDNGSYASFFGNVGLEPQPVILENIEIARLLHWFGSFTNKEAYSISASKTFDFLTTPLVAKNYYSEPAILSLAAELENEMNNHIGCGEGSKELVQHAYTLAPFYSRFAHYSEKDLPDDKKDMFASFDAAVIFVCTSSYCSSPLESIDEVQSFFAR